jgi:hypothetical protein
LRVQIERKTGFDHHRISSAEANERGTEAGGPEWFATTHWSVVLAVKQSASSHGKNGLL